MYHIYKTCFALDIVYIQTDFMHQPDLAMKRSGIWLNTILRFPVSMLLVCVLGYLCLYHKTIMDTCILLSCTHDIDVLG